MYQNIIGKPTETSYTDVEGIKEGSFHYVEQVNEEGNLRYGSVISSYVEFEVYGNNPSFAVGDELYYIQRTDQSKTFEDGAIRNIKINTFIVKTVEKFKTTYKYTAYDYISKLDVDVSSELLALKDSFPLTAAIILSSYISHWCSIRIDWSSLYWYTGSNTYVPTIPFFYYNGITARDIVARLAELNSQFVVAVQHQGYVQIEFQSSTGYSNWDSLSNMIICPTDLIDYYGTGSQSETRLIPIWYKENGLNKADYTCAVLNRAIIRRNSGEIVYDSDDDAWQPLPSGDNVYTIYGNYIAESLYDAGTSGINMFYSCRANVARILNYNITPMTVKLFPFRNPYRAGNIIQNMADADGNRFASFAMKMEITDESATLYCYGDEKYQPYSGDDISSLRASVESNIEEVRDGKVSKSGDTMTGTLVFDLPDKDGTVKIQPVSQGSGTHQGLMIQGATGLIFGSGEAPTNAYNADLNSIQTTASEDLILLSDGKIVGYVNCNTIANAIKAFEILATGEVNLNLPLSISSGGTGQNGVSITSTISDILTAGTNVTVSAAQFAIFGKVAQLRIVFSRSSAVASGNTTIATLTSGKTPVFNALATCHTNHDLVAYVNANGNVVVNGPISANTSYTVYSTYILA